MSGCAEEDPHLLYGSEIYPNFAGICISSYFSSVIQEKGGSFSLKIMKSPNGYLSVKKSLTSKAWDNPTPLAFIILNTATKVFRPFPGMMVDTFYRNNWMEGIITKTTALKENFWEVEVEI